MSLRLLAALALTLAVECTLAGLIFRRRAPVMYVALCSVMTNPVANLLALGAVGLWGLTAWWPAVAVIECAVVAVEAALLHRLLEVGYWRALALSLVLNGASFGLGLLIG